MLDQNQIDFFHSEGYLIMRGLVLGAELRQLQDAADAVICDGVSRKNPELHRYMAGANGREVYWRSEEMWQCGEVWKAVTVNPVLLENIGQCIGHPFFPWNDSLVVKLPDNGAPVPWHQDPPYRNRDRETVFPIPNFTTDIYMDRSCADNGCVWAIPSHHLVGHVDLTCKSQEDLFTRCGAVPLEMEPGDVLFHCLSTPHGSGGNVSGGLRRTFYVHYLTQEVYEDGYAPEAWSVDKPGLTPQRSALIEGMMAARRELGWADTQDCPTLRWTGKGFRVSGGPMTPPRHWEALSAEIPADRRKSMKRLQSPI